VCLLPGALRVAVLLLHIYMRSERRYVSRVV
jgi:hypothetical protein